MSVVKEGLLYSKSHEWVETLPDGTARIGISDYAQDSLGDIVFVDMHPAGEEVEAEGALADVESVKAVSEIYYEYERQLKANNAMDFDDLLFNTVRLFKENQDILDYYQNRFNFIRN